MKIDAGINGTLGDRTYKLHSGITSEYGRYVESLGEPVTGRAPWSSSQNR